MKTISMCTEAVDKEYDFPFTKVRTEDFGADLMAFTFLLEAWVDSR